MRTSHRTPVGCGPIPLIGPGGCQSGMSFTPGEFVPLVEIRNHEYRTTSTKEERLCKVRKEDSNGTGHSVIRNHNELSADAIGKAQDAGGHLVDDIHPCEVDALKRCCRPRATCASNDVSWQSCFNCPGIMHQRSIWERQPHAATWREAGYRCAKRWRMRPPVRKRNYAADGRLTVASH